MPTNPYIISRKPAERGAAQANLDLIRRVRRLESTYGLVGSGATVTAPTIQTADVGSKVYMSSSGLFYANASGASLAGMVPGQGFVLLGGTGTENAVTWLAAIPGSARYSQLTSYLIASDTTQLYLASYTPDQSGSANWVKIAAQNSSGSSGQITALCNGNSVTLVGSTGGGSWFSGALNATAFNTWSDQAMKEGIQDLPSKHVQMLRHLRPVIYRNTQDGETYFGLVAQEAEKHLPDLVKTIVRREDKTLTGLPAEPQEVKAISLSSLATLLVAGFQELEKRLSELESKQ